MTEQDKKLLLVDLCARLPYGNLYANIIWEDGIERQVPFINTGVISDLICDEIKDIKPYLRPMSSMTEEEKEKLQLLHDTICDENYEDGYSPVAWNAIVEWEDYCNSNHLDYRGLIPMGLALEAPEGMYK